MNDSKQDAWTRPRPNARRVIADALTARHEELHGEASPIDFDGAAQVLRALDEAGFTIIRKSP